MTEHRCATQEIRFVSRPSGGELYTALTLPAEDSPPSQVALICPPIFEEYGRSYAILREFARQLCAHGIGALRFDYVGIGESHGDPDSFSVSSAIADISFLASWLTERFPTAKVVPIGMRVGCRLTLDALAPEIRSGSSNIATPILWDPVLDMRDYILGELRSTIASAMVIFRAAVASRDDIVRETLDSGSCERDGCRLNHIDGYTVTRELLRDVGVGESAAWSFSEPVFVLVTVGAGDGERQRKQLVSRLPGMKFHAVRDTTYWNQPPIYSQTREHLFGVTQQCMEQCK